ncbi:MAG TPA: family 16 glycoside hydrolase [Pyrinomonadaceae bacterium]|nr:family 16 glycoside hydrolase [Pyrinomonadaceae bacterium]
MLADDDFVYTSDQDYVITIEAIGSSIRVYQDNEPVFAVTDAAYPNGAVGLYCWANVGTRFSDVRVDDLSQISPIAYRFSFTTSNFADFNHHLHSFNDESWTTEAVDNDVAAEIATAVAPTNAVGDAETRAYTSFAKKVLGAAAQNPVESVEVHRITVNQVGVGLLLRSPEPIDWKRTALQLSFAAGLVDAPAVPGVAKITDVSPGGSSPNDEVVTILARERTTLARSSIETYNIPRPLRDTIQDVLLDDTFDRPGGVLLDEEFGANALDRFHIVDAPGAIMGPSQWSVSGNAIIQSSNLYAGPVMGTDPARLGTMAITGERWSNIRLSVRLLSGDNDAIGVVFRYTDEQNWYRFSMDRQRQYRRLVKCVAGTITVLWEDNVVYDLSVSYDIRIDAYGDVLLGYLDNELLFVVQDADLHEGQVGFYAWANIHSRFESLRVESLETSPVLFTVAFQNLDELTIVDTGTVGGPSVWAVNAGVLTQTSNIGSDEPPVGIARPGTVALLEPNFGDFELSASLTSLDSTIGVVFRYLDDNNWYRFTMDRQIASRRLVRCVAGVHTVIWQDSVLYQPGRRELTVTAEGPRLRAWLDGTALFDVQDDELRSGRVGLYSWANVNAQFDRVVITDPVRRIGYWEIVDRATTGAPSVWRVSNGTLKQRGIIGEAALPDALGTWALVRQAAWTDYRIVARLRSDDDGAIGIVFRYQDDNNWYRVSHNAQLSYRRLVKCTAGVVTTLWESVDSYDVGTPFTITIDCIGPRLLGYHNDELLFDVTDGNHPTGGIALYCSQNDGARFERVTVSLPPLDAYAIFRDRFHVGDLSSWTIVDEGPVSSPSAWAIANGALRQTSNIHSLPVDPVSLEKRGTQALAGSNAWTDIVLSVRLNSADDDAIGVLFRYTDANNFYRFSMDRERSYRRLVRAVGGVFTTLWEDDTQYELNRSYDLVVAAVGPRINVWIDGVPVAEVEDATLNSGQIGLYCWANTGAQFSNVRVFTSDRLSWNTLLSEDFEFELPGRWTIVTSGTESLPETWTFTGGELRQTSNVWGGSVLAGELLKPGTAAIYTQPQGLGPAGIVPGSESWTDYRVTVRLRSDDDDAIGVLVRYQDEDNWYRFSMDRERAYRRLIKCLDGAVTELWSDTVAYISGREYLVTMDVIDDAIVGYLDGVPLFSVRDDTHAGGTIGLYCWGNTGARFSSVRVTSAEWSTYYRFSIDEELLAAGTRVAIHSGNSTAWTVPPTPGLKHRFAASMHDSGRFQLQAVRPVDLRWRDGVGAIGHMRRFLPQPSYTGVAGLMVLRKADGTEAALFVPAAADPGSAIDEGQYRLRFTYRRNNTALDPGSTILSRAGDSSNERVTLDIPDVR